MLPAWDEACEYKLADGFGHRGGEYGGEGEGEDPSGATSADQSLRVRVGMLECSAGILFSSRMASGFDLIGGAGLFSREVRLGIAGAAT